MAITGIKSVVYGVDDIGLSARFFDEFGLERAPDHEGVVKYELEEGSEILLRDVNDPSLPAPWFDGSGIREVVLGVDSKPSLEELVQDLSRDRDVERRDDGVAIFRSDIDEIPFGLKVFERRPVKYEPDDVNAAGNIRRLNRTRKWKERAYPKTISHVVFRVSDPEASWTFFEDRLHFRLSDIARGVGVFGRADGVHEHHTLFLARAGAPGQDPEPGPDHVCFGVEDLDEVVIGANYMQRRGWHTHHGLGRHRISSQLFYYLHCPAGGLVEYGADSDYLDDEWIPREWSPEFGYAAWVADLPEFLHPEPNWDVRLLEDGKSATPRS